MPVSSAPPGGLAPAETPQMILITFDDAVNVNSHPHVDLIRNHRNPDDSPVAFTFFVSANYTDYWMVHELHAGGHEIAVHTITHSTGVDTDMGTWVREIDGCREVLSRLAGIPLADIRGFRAPYLAYNAAMFEALSALGFAYGSSVTESPGGLSVDGSSYIWPYSLHDGLKQAAHTGTPPSASLPDLMEVPMWNLLEGATRHNMDPSGSRESLFAMFQSNFLARYEGNRAPMGIWLHASPWMNNAENVAALNDFLAWALERPDAWVVGMGTMIEWMKQPVSAAVALTEARLQTRTYEPIPESQAYSQNFGNGYVRSVGERPVTYPTPSTAFMRSTAVEGVQLEIAVLDAWAATFQAQIIVTHSESGSFSDWSITLDPGEAQILAAWGNGGYRIEDDGMVVFHPNWAGPHIAPGGFTLLTFSASGKPSDLGTLSGRFFKPSFAAPRLATTRDAGADAPRLQWNRTAPIYELQWSRTGREDDWETVETFYGQTEAPMPRDGARALYRLRCVY